MYAKSPRIVQSANSYFSGGNFILRISNYFTEQDDIFQDEKCRLMRNLSLSMANWFRNFGKRNTKEISFKSNTWPISNNRC